MFIAELVKSGVVTHVWDQSKLSYNSFDKFQQELSPFRAQLQSRAALIAMYAARVRNWSCKIRVTNAGLFPHQVLLIRLPDGVSDRHEMAWFRDNFQTDRPGRPSGGLLELPPSETGWFAVSLRPGRYLLLCGFADGTIRHFDKGMSRVIEVGG